ncbi:hypothetical protein ACFL1I_03925 [Candidatus Omnitrophota bacterium]
MSQILDTSITILFLQDLGKCCAFAQRIYHNSQIHNLAKGFWEKINVYYRYSFLARTIQPKGMTATLTNSLAVQYLINFYKRYADKMVCFLRGSLAFGLAKDAEEQLNFSPVELISLILITAIFVNAFLIVVLQKPIDLWGFVIRLVFLLIATVGFYRNAEKN